MPQCFGRTKTFVRCRRETARFFCLHHRWQPVVAILSITSLVAMFAGLYQDLLKPLGAWQVSPEHITRIEIPLSIRNELKYDAMINQSVEYYLTRSTSPSSEEVIDSGIVRISTPNGFTRVNEKIAISPGQTLHTSLQLPESKVLADAFTKGGYGLKVVINNEWIDHFSVPKDVPFDNETLENGIRLSIWKRH